MKKCQKELMERPNVRVSWKLLKYSIDGIVNFSNVPLMIYHILDCYDVRIFPCNCIYYSPKDDFWGSRKWMTVFGMHYYYFVGGIQLVLHGNYGAIFVKETYMEVKRDPHYVICCTNDDEAQKNK